MALSPGSGSGFSVDPSGGSEDVGVGDTPSLSGFDPGGFSVDRDDPGDDDVPFGDITGGTGSFAVIGDWPSSEVERSLVSRLVQTLQERRLITGTKAAIPVVGDLFATFGWNYADNPPRERLQALMNDSAQFRNFQAGMQGIVDRIQGLEDPTNPTAQRAVQFAWNRALNTYEQTGNLPTPAEMREELGNRMDPTHPDGPRLGFSPEIPMSPDPTYVERNYFPEPMLNPFMGPPPPMDQWHPLPSRLSGDEIQASLRSGVNVLGFAPGLENIQPTGFTGGPLTGTPREVAAAVNQVFGGPGLQTFSTDSGQGVTLFVNSRGELLNPIPIVQGLAAKIRNGGTLTANQRALVGRLTPAQQRAMGIFVTPAGEAVPVTTVLERGLQNAAAGRPLTTNQQVALGLVFRNTPNVGSAHRDLVNQLTGTAGSKVRANISAAVQQSIRTTRDITQIARRQTEAAAEATAAARQQAVRRTTRREILDVIGRDQTFVTRTGKTVDARTVVTNALRRRDEGKPLTENQKAALRVYRQVTGREVKARQVTATARVESKQAAARQSLLERQQRQQVRQAEAPVAQRAGLSARQQLEIRQQAARQQKARNQQQKRQELNREIARALPGANRKALLQERERLLAQQKAGRQAQAERQKSKTAEVKQQARQVAKKQEQTRAKVEASQAAARQRLAAQQQAKRAESSAAQRAALVARQEVQTRQQAKRQATASKQQEKRQALNAKIALARSEAERTRLLQQKQRLLARQEAVRQAQKERQAEVRKAQRQREQRREEERKAAQRAQKAAALKAAKEKAREAAERERTARIAADKRARQLRIATEQRARETRIASEQRARETRIAADRRARELRIAADRQAQAQRVTNRELLAKSARKIAKQQDAPLKVIKYAKRNLKIGRPLNAKQLAALGR